MGVIIYGLYYVCMKYTCLIIKNGGVTSSVMSFNWVLGGVRVFQHNIPLASWTSLGLITPGPSPKNLKKN